MKDLNLKVVASSNTRAGDKVMNFAIVTDSDKVLAKTHVRSNEDGSCSFIHRTTLGGIVYKLVLMMYNIVFNTRLTMEIDRKIDIDKNADIILSAISSLLGKGLLPTENNFWSFDREEMKSNKKVKVYSFNKKEAVDYLSSISTPVSM